MTVTRGASVCAAASVAGLLVIALAVAVSGRADRLRELLDLDFGGVDRTPAAVLDIAANNAQLALGLLVCAMAAPRVGCVALRMLDAGVAAVLAANVLVVGAALGAYGGRAVAILAPHLPLELAALSLCGGAYLSARTGTLPGRTLARTAALIALLFAVAGALETYVQIGVQP